MSDDDLDPVVFEPKRRGRPPKADDTVAAAAPAAPAKTTVSMKRHGEGYKPPHTAEVHPDEVENWAKHGWERAD